MVNSGMSATMAYMDPEIVTGDIARVFDGEPVRSRDAASFQHSVFLSDYADVVADYSGCPSPDSSLL